MIVKNKSSKLNFASGIETVVNLPNHTYNREKHDPTEQIWSYVAPRLALASKNINKNSKAMNEQQKREIS